MKLQSIPWKLCDQINMNGFFSRIHFQIVYDAFAFALVFVFKSLIVLDIGFWLHIHGWDRVGVGQRRMSVFIIYYFMRFIQPISTFNTLTYVPNRININILYIRRRECCIVIRQRHTRVEYSRFMLNVY